MRVASVLLLLVCGVLSHGSISLPAFRANPKVNGGWCPFCQGDASKCASSTDWRCSPPSPCWGAPGPDRVDSSKFNGAAGGGDTLKDADGKYWVDHNSSGTLEWCRGHTYDINFYNHADHNGIFRWESQLAAPGQETEEGFKNFSDWISINNDPSLKYFSKDGVTSLPLGTCVDGSKWADTHASCMSGTWMKTTVSIPADLPEGQTVIRWIWYGAMSLSGGAPHRVNGPEVSLFVNCGDVTIKQCGPPVPTPAPPTPASGCPGGSMKDCMMQCPASTFHECAIECGENCPQK